MYTISRQDQNDQPIVAESEAQGFGEQRVFNQYSMSKSEDKKVVKELNSGESLLTDKETSDSVDRNIGNNKSFVSRYSEQSSVGAMTTHTEMLEEQDKKQGEDKGMSTKR